MSIIDAPALDSAVLADGFDGRVVTPADTDYDEVRQTFNVLLDQRPSLIAIPAGERDVIAAVAFAREHGLRVVPQTTGHNAGPLGDLGGAMLVKTTEMKGVEIDAERRIARVAAGTVWEDVVPAASEMGLAALHGSSPDVGVVGYSLGGGMGWYARKHGLQTNHVTAIELVTADAELVRATATERPELFWALRGGGGNFGVVTAIEFRLFPVPEVYAGALFFPWERASEVLHTWFDLLPSLPDEITSVGRILQIPPFPDIPEPLRGRSFVVVEATHLGTQAEGEALLAPLRELGPEIDTLAMVPPAGISELHMDPRAPVPARSTHALVDIPPASIDELVAVAGPGSASPLVSVELRHMGGALARSHPEHGARDTLDGELCMFAVGVPATRELGAAVDGSLADVAGVFAPYAAGRYLNFVEEACRTERAFSDDSWARLRAVKAELDPTDLFLANHPIAGGR